MRKGNARKVSHYICCVLHRMCFVFSFLQFKHISILVLSRLQEREEALPRGARGSCELMVETESKRITVKYGEFWK
jgi:hypothetical protein